MNDEANNPAGSNSGPGSRPSPAPAHTYTYESLYSGSGRSERPRLQDVQQNSIANCEVVSAMGALAQHQPNAIKDAITYDPRSGNFGVRLYNSDGSSTRVLVSQSDIADNINRGGGSTLDGNPGRTTPVWPAVIETAIAKQNDSNHADGLAEGYRALRMTAGSAMHAITGQNSRVIDHAEAESIGENRLYDQLSRALASGRPVTLSTAPQERAGIDDGLADDHGYIVQRVSKDKDGNLMLELRNPWATNTDGERPDSTSPVVTVRYDTLDRADSLKDFTIGPAPVVQRSSLDADSTGTRLASAPTMPGVVNTGDQSLNHLLRSMQSGNLDSGMQTFARSPDAQEIRQQGRVELDTKLLAEAQLREQPMQQQESPNTRRMA